VGNRLRILPPDIGKLTKLRVLAADSNQLTILPGKRDRPGVVWRQAVWKMGQFAGVASLRSIAPIGYRVPGPQSSPAWAALLQGSCGSVCCCRS
jgi:Leucine-rich repeat (LRR) protein